RRLQLTLYALAVEQVLLAGQAARPLGLAYWLVAGEGPKGALPRRQQLLLFRGTGGWGRVRRRVRRWVATRGTQHPGGGFHLKPRSEHCTQTCDFGHICRIAQARSVPKAWELPLPGPPDNDEMRG